jgi:hypothetical protein
MEPASTNTSATPFMKVCALPPSHLAPSWSSTVGKTEGRDGRERRVFVHARVLGDHRQHLGVVGLIGPHGVGLGRDGRKSPPVSEFSATQPAGPEVTSKTRMPSSVFSSPVSSTLPCSFTRRSAPPQPQNMSTEPCASAAAPRRGPCRRFPCWRRSTPKWLHLLEKAVMRGGAERHGDLLARQLGRVGLVDLKRLERRRSCRCRHRTPPRRGSAGPARRRSRPRRAARPG